MHLLVGQQKAIVSPGAEFKADGTGAVLRRAYAGGVVARHPRPWLGVDITRWATGFRSAALCHLRPWHAQARCVEIPEAIEAIAWKGSCRERPQICRGRS